MNAIILFILSLLKKSLILKLQCSYIYQNIFYYWNNFLEIYYLCILTTFSSFILAMFIAGFMLLFLGDKTAEKTAKIL